MKGKAIKGKPAKKSGASRKARPRKGRAKPLHAKRPASKAKAAKAAGRGPAARSKRKSVKSTAAPKSGAARKPLIPRPLAKRAEKAGRALANTVLGIASKTVTRIVEGTARRIARTVGAPSAKSPRSGGRRAKVLPRPSVSAARPAPVRPARQGTTSGVAINGPRVPRLEEILTSPALTFLADLHREFDARRQALLQASADRQPRFDAGELPDFPAATKSIRDGDWKVAPIPADLLDRRVEITGPVDRKMIVNALNSGATDYMADFEDANSPTWANNIAGQVNLKDLWAGKIDFTDPDSGKHYAVGPKPAVLIVRPRGWHLPEAHLLVDGAPMSGSLFDFGLYFFHNAKAQIAKGTGPYFYLPKLESHLEARLWNEVFVFAQDRLGIPQGSIRATVLIETLPAAFEMDEILWELRDHIAGMNAGRWDFIFSFIKTFAKNPNYVLPDRSQVVMGEAFLGAYAALLVRTCHRRGAFAMGGMAAQIPIKNDPAANAAAFAKVRADKEREVRDGYDGTWVAHPDLVPVAKEVFDRMMPQPNQLQRVRLHVHVLRDDLLKIHAGTKTEAGFRLNIRVGVRYIEAWLRGHGAVPIYHLMEDAATAEISRAQIWQWIKYGAVLENGTKVTPELFTRSLGEEMERVKEEVGADTYAGGRFPEAIKLFRDISLAPDFVEFLTIPAYELIL
ncbi:MAG: malate synthase [Alphaproteobacteria bacterium]|nr:malate synthase [Alphaproteobacteria bacterium]